MVAGAKRKPRKLPGNRKRSTPGRVTAAFCEWVNNTISQAGMTPMELSEKCGVSARQIYRILNGEVSPRLVTAELISLALGYELSEVIK